MFTFIVILSLSSWRLLQANPILRASKPTEPAKIAKEKENVKPEKTEKKTFVASNKCILLLWITNVKGLEAWPALLSVLTTELGLIVHPKFQIRVLWKYYSKKSNGFYV